MTPILIGACAKPAGAMSVPAAATVRPTRSSMSQRFCIEVTSVLSLLCSSRAARLGTGMIADGVYSGRSRPGPMIIRELQRLHHARGFVPRAELSAVAARLGVPLYRVHEVASFFPQFRAT